MKVPSASTPKKSGMKKKNYIYLIGLMIPNLLLAQAGRKQVLEGNAAYAEKKYDAAANAYQDALIEDPASPIIQYNMGAAQYQKSDFEKALESYNKTLDADDPLLQARTYYNMGNVLFRTQKMQEAIQAYEQALKLNPDDEDAKYNLEFVRNKLKENSKPQQNQPKDKQQQQDQKQQQQQQNQDQQNKDKQKQQQQQKEQQQQNQDREQKKEEQQQKPQPQEKQETEMSEKEAEQLLNALKEDQKDLQKKKAQAVGGGRVGKDW